MRVEMAERRYEGNKEGELFQKAMSAIEGQNEEVEKNLEKSVREILSFSATKDPKAASLNSYSTMVATPSLSTYSVLISSLALDVVKGSMSFDEADAIVRIHAATSGSNEDGHIMAASGVKSESLVEGMEAVEDAPADPHIQHDILNMIPNRVLTPNPDWRTSCCNCKERWRMCLPI